MRLFKVVFLCFTTVFFIKCTEKKISYPLSRYVPNDTSYLILKTNDYTELKEKIGENTLLKELLEDGYNFNLFDSIRANFKEVYIAFSKSESSKKYETTIISRYNNAIFSDSLTMLQMKLKLMKNHEVIECSYANKKIYASIVEGVFISSTARDVVKNIIAQPKDFVQNKTLDNLYANSLKNSHVSVFIKNKHSNPILNHFFKKMPVTKDFFDWLMFDVSLTKKRIAFNGVSVSHSKKSIQKLFYNTQPLESKTPKIAPNNVDEITSYTFKDASIFFQNIISQNSNISLSVLNAFLNVDEIGILCDKKSKAVILHVKNMDIALNSLSIPKTTSVISVKNKPASKLLKSAFSILTGDFTANYATTIGDFIIFSQTENFLYKINSYYRNGLTYSNASFYSVISDNILKSANILKIRLLEDIVKKTYTAFAFQVSNEGEFSFTNAALQNVSAPKSSLGINKIFELNLDSDVATNPQFFTNYITGKKDILVQDSGNALYLIDYTGQIIWKKDLDGKILGKIQEVDLYKNGRIQLAFTTKNSFTILDRNGNAVKPFEMTFSRPITQPVSVFDYDSNKNYRFVITTKDIIYMYNRRGNIVKGFTYTKHRSPLLFEPKHIRIGKRDYIIIAMQDGTLKILNRQGKIRIRLKEKIDFSNKFFLYKNMITSSDKKGNLIQITEKGKIKKTKLPVKPNYYIEASTKSLFTLSDYTLTIKGNPVILEEGKYTSPKMFYINDVIYICVTNLITNRVYVYHSNGELLEHFPVKGSSVVDLADIDKDRQLELVVKNDDNSINLYKIKSPL